MRTSRRLQVRLPASLADELAGFATSRGQSLAGAARLLLSDGLELERRDRSQAGEGGALSLAALVAAEHAVLLVASILPEGERRRLALAERASQAAEERLELFRRQAPTGELP